MAQAAEVLKTKDFEHAQNIWSLASLRQRFAKQTVLPPFFAVAR